MLASDSKIRPCALGLLLLPLIGCQRERHPDAPELVSNNSGVQMRFEVARAMVADIARRRQHGKEIYGDCKMARALFLRELKRTPAEASQRVARQLVRLCAGAARRARERGGQH